MNFGNPEKTPNLDRPEKYNRVADYVRKYFIDGHVSIDQVNGCVERRTVPWALSKAVFEDLGITVDELRELDHPIYNTLKEISEEESGK